MIKDKAKSPFDFQLILNGFNEHFIFKSVPQEDIEQIVAKMFYCTVPDGQFVFKQGDEGTTYFMIERGQCQIIINGDLKKTLKSGEAFGELALLYNAPRSASVKAVGGTISSGSRIAHSGPLTETLSVRWSSIKT